MHKSISDSIRLAVQQSGLSTYRLALEAKVEEKSLRKYLAGKVGLSMPALDRLADVLGLRLQSN